MSHRLYQIYLSAGSMCCSKREGGRFKLLQPNFGGNKGWAEVLLLITCDSSMLVLPLLCLDLLRRYFLNKQIV
jgi:hypothetical protein